jgi:sugar lactone lactonase YvrE
MPNAAMAELVVDARNGVGESPVWVATEQALYWTDIPARRMHRLSVASGALEQWDLPEMAGCMAPHARGGWIAAMETGIFHLHLHGGGLATASGWPPKPTASLACASTMAGATARAASWRAP